MDVTKTIKAIVILDGDGKRIISKFFDKRENIFERKLYMKTKTHRVRDEVLALDSVLVLHSFVTDIHMYVVGDKNENPLILDAVLNCLTEVVESVLNKKIERQCFHDHLSQMILALDEICENGVILETDSNLVLQRVYWKKEDQNEQSMAQKLQSATEAIRFPWLRS